MADLYQLRLSFVYDLPCTHSATADPRCQRRPGQCLGEYGSADVRYLLCCGGRSVCGRLRGNVRYTSARGHEQVHARYSTGIKRCQTPEES